jgi:tRNA (mo5U34)-methyltransferase
MYQVNIAGPGDSDFVKKMNGLSWFHRFEVAPGVVTPGVTDVSSQMSRLGIAADLSGQTVLDIGSYDGGLSFECERRGALRVVAYDYGQSRPTAQLLAEHLKSHVEFRYGTIYTLDPGKIGKFDLIIFAGVLYHLRYPALGIDRIRTVATDAVHVETYVLPDSQSTPFSIFYENTELNADPTNWVGPNVAQVLAWLRSAGFDVEKSEKWPGDRGTFLARVRQGMPPYLFTQNPPCDQRAQYDGLNLEPQD